MFSASRNNMRHDDNVSIDGVSSMSLAAGTELACTLNGAPATLTLERVLGGDEFSIFYWAEVVSGGASIADQQLTDHGLIVEEFLPAALAERSEGTKAVLVTGRRNQRNFKACVDRFRAEGQLLSGFHDTNCIALFDHNNTCYRVFEPRRDGYRSLGELVRNQRDDVSESFIRSIIDAVLPQLDRLHATNALHRGISPESILVHPDGEVLLDGHAAARYMLAERTQNLASWLESGFAPFEFMQRRDNQGPCSDLYALGATLYYAIAGAAPVDARERFDLLQNREPDPLPALVTRGDELRSECGHSFSRDLLATVDWMLNLRIQDRPKSAVEVSARMHADVDVPAVLLSARDNSTRLPIQAVAPESRSAAARARVETASIGRRRWISAGVAACVLAIVTTVVVLKPGGWQAMTSKPQTTTAMPAVGAANAASRASSTRTSSVAEILETQARPEIRNLLSKARQSMGQARYLRDAPDTPSALTSLERVLELEPENVVAREGINHLLFHFVSELQLAENAGNGVEIRVINSKLRRIRLRHPESRPVRSEVFFAKLPQGTEHSRTDHAAGILAPIDANARDFFN